MNYDRYAKYYDIFYINKKYDSEVDFINNIINDKGKNILDIGCGTGIHASMLEKMGYSVDLVDLSQEMLEFARKRTTGEIYNQDLLKLKINKKYDVIISMFAVINHLKNISQLEKALTNMKDHLKNNGVIILDLHNPNSSGDKIDTVNNMRRKMSWHYDEYTKIETSEIVYEVDNKKYVDKQIFRIFIIDEINGVCDKIGLKVLNAFENYSFKTATRSSKNIQIVIANYNRLGKNK